MSTSNLRKRSPNPARSVKEDRPGRKSLAPGIAGIANKEAEGFSSAVRAPDAVDRSDTFDSPDAFSLSPYTHFTPRLGLPTSASLDLKAALGSIPESSAGATSETQRRLRGEGNVRFKESEASISGKEEESRENLREEYLAEVDARRSRMELEKLLGSLSPPEFSKARADHASRLTSLDSPGTLSNTETSPPPLPPAESVPYRTTLRRKAREMDLSGLGMSEIAEDVEDGDRDPYGNSRFRGGQSLANSRIGTPQWSGATERLIDSQGNGRDTTGDAHMGTKESQGWTESKAGHNIASWRDVASSYIPWYSRSTKPAPALYTMAAAPSASQNGTRLPAEDGPKSELSEPNPFAAPIGSTRNHAGFTASGPLASPDDTTPSGNAGSRDHERNHQDGGRRPGIRLVRSSTTGTSEGGETLLRSGTVSDRTRGGLGSIAETQSDADSTPRVDRPGEGTGSLTPRTYLPDSPYIYPAHITTSYGYTSPNTAYTPTPPSAASLQRSSVVAASAEASAIAQPLTHQLRYDSLAYRASKHRLTHRQSPLPADLKTIARSPRHVISGSPIVGLETASTGTNGASASSYWGPDNLIAGLGSKAAESTSAKGLLEGMLRESYEARRHRDAGNVPVGHDERSIRSADKPLPVLPLVPRAPIASTMSRDASDDSTSTAAESDTLVGSGSDNEKVHAHLAGGMMERDGTTSTFASKGSLPLPDFFMRKTNVLRSFRQDLPVDPGLEIRGATRQVESEADIEIAVAGISNPDAQKRPTAYVTPLLPLALQLAGNSGTKLLQRAGGKAIPMLASQIPQLRSIYRSKSRWGKLKIILLLSVLTLFGYGLALIIWSIQLWSRTIPLTDVSFVSDTHVVAYVTVAGSICFFNALVGLTGALLNSRPILAVYALLLWPCLLSLCFIGYSSYKRESMQLDLKLSQAWTQILNDEQRLRIQQALNCCGFFNPFHEATYSRNCYPRAPLPGCKANWLRFERETLKTFATVAFSLIPLHLLNIVASLICSNHVDQRYGKGMTPKQYRLSLADVHGNAALVVSPPKAENDVAIQNNHDLKVQ